MAEVGFGAGSPLLGGAGGLVRSMMGGVPALGQQSPASAGFQPGLQVPQYPPLPNKSPASAIGATPQQPPAQGQQPQQGGSITIPGVQDQSPQQPGLQIPLSEAQMIVKTLSGRLSHLSKGEPQAPALQM